MTTSSFSVTPLPRLLYSRVKSACQLSLSVRAIDHMIAQGMIGTRKIGGRRLSVDQRHGVRQAPVRAPKQEAAHFGRPSSLLVTDYFFLAGVW